MPKPKPAPKTDGPPRSERFTTVLDATNTAVDAIKSGLTIDRQPRRASALREYCKAIYQNDGIIKQLALPHFREQPGTLLFRGVSNYVYVRENLNGDWYGTGFYTDGNYYTGLSSKNEAIGYYGLSGWSDFGWTIALKLSPLAHLIELNELLNMPLRRFIDKVHEQFPIDTALLQTIHQSPSDNAFTAVLMGYDGVVDTQQDHYIVYNNERLAFLRDSTPWAHQLEPEPPEFLSNPSNLGGDQYPRPSTSAVQHRISAEQQQIVDKPNPITLEYQSASQAVLMVLEELSQ